MSELIEQLLNQSDDEYAKLIKERINVEKPRGSKPDALLVLLFSEKLRIRTFKILGRLLLRWEKSGLSNLKKKLIFFMRKTLNVDTLIKSFNSADVWTVLFNEKNEALALLEMFAEIQSDFLRQVSDYCSFQSATDIFGNHLKTIVTLEEYQQLALKNGLKLEKVQEIIENNKQNTWEESKDKVLFSCYRCLVILVQQNKYHHDAIAAFRGLLKQASPTLLDQIEKDFNSYNKTDWKMSGAMQKLYKHYPEEFLFRVAAVDKTERAIADIPLIPYNFFGS